jgi:hypothetical protein
MEMLNEYWSSESSPAEGFCHPIECNPKENPFNIQYVRSKDVPSGDSQLLYDLGVTHVAVTGMQASGNAVGDLWITYEVELKKPVLTSNVTGTVGYLLSSFAGSPSPANLFNGTCSQRGSVEVIASSGTILTLKFPHVGIYTISVGFQGPSISGVNNGTAPTITSGSAAFAFVDQDGSTVTWYSNATGTFTAAATITQTIALIVSDSSSNVVLTYPTWAITGTISKVWVNISERDL